MIDYREIYSTKADAYDLLVTREDYQQNITKSLQAIRPLEQLEVADMGTGTGRITRILSPQVRHVLAMDISSHMLRKAEESLRKNPDHNWALVQGDNLTLPLRDRAVDIAIAGWSLGHLTGWYPDAWPVMIEQCLSEMKRIVTQGGTVIILETLGTGRETPQPPTDALAGYYSYMVNELGFTESWVRSDYHFQSLDEALHLSRFFFGEELAQQVARNKSSFLPECTGIWWLNV